MKQAASARSSWLRVIASSTVVLALAGCAAPQVASLQQRWPQALSPVARIASVPFYPQSDYQCGPAALAMVATAAGAQVQPEQLVSEVYLPARQGSLQLEMLAAGRRLGLVTHQIRPDLEALLQEVAAGNPVVVLQNLSFQFAPVWHYAVAVGFNRDSNTITLHSGRTENMEMSLHAFERTWERSGRWAMLAMPPDRLPAAADASSYSASIAALERSSPVAARKAYAKALSRWPADPVLQLGAGNTAYAQRDFEGAVHAYQKLVATHPGIADGWNNLAQALLDQGHRREAMAAIGKAVALGGPRLNNYRQLQQEIQARR